ncbi:MAG: Phosphomannomutase [Candidatus Woesebacteria bacterium GW2011_GWD2_40_19]|nr:MAG: Phosphomannomutase [Candidatus Woesebacteria bacterium GW2011_GWD2_40_19]
MKQEKNCRILLSKYFISGEINSDVSDKEGKMNEIAQKYSDAEVSRLDGVAVEYPDYRFCVRPSNTESLLRLTLEAKSKELMEQKRDEVLAIIRS